MASSKIKTRDNYGLVVQNSNLTVNNYTYDLLNSVSQKLATGKVDEAIALLNDMKKSVAGHHPLYPYYSTEIENKNGSLVFVSKPNSKEAIEKFPPTYKGKMTIPAKYKEFASMNELLDYSYRNQEDIEINVKEIRKVLGHFDDPYQDEIFSPDSLKNLRFKIKHQEFPPAMPFKIVFSNSDYSLDYILLRFNRITDDEKFILNNSEQDTNLFIEIIIDSQNRKCDFNIKIKDKFIKGVKANLAFIDFMINCKERNEIKVISLEDREELISGFLDNMNFVSNFEDTAKEKEFLEELRIVEDYYGKEINLPDEIYEEDIENVEILAKGIKDKKVIGRFTGFNMEFELTDQLKESIIKNKDKIFPIIYEMKDVRIKIFGQPFKIGRVVRRFENIKIADSDKLLKKIEVLDLGDKIKIKHIPADKQEDEFIDEFYFEYVNKQDER
ncbi:abortive infection system toxin AbiGii family protein [Brassicibacter mesophilus]|uniref:abortive infection system toxin AbiGii family protein n=1 Tax=Brassicibacter mesophilus TaxID=745119 RepID=UPI003D1CB79D